MKMKGAIAAAGLAALLGSAGLVATGSAQPQDHGEHGAPTGSMMHGETGAQGGMHHGPGEMQENTAGSPATEAYRAANRAMHEAMDIGYTGDADIDFARGMIGHHQGAIDMARIMLEYGQDPELRRLAEEVIQAQEAEIAFLRDWLAKHLQ